jgi:hypothetical protein
VIGEEERNYSAAGSPEYADTGGRSTSCGAERGDMANTKETAAAAPGSDESKVSHGTAAAPSKFSGSGDALYDRHLTFDDFVDVAEAGPRHRTIAEYARDIWNAKPCSVS